jgi:outer membrane protein assembly factor BamB
MMFRWLVLAALITGLMATWRPIMVNADDQPRAADWPQFRGPHRDDLSADKGLLKEWPKEGPSLIWKASGIGSGHASVSIANGKIFTMGDRNYQENGKNTKACFVIALNQADGREMWATKICPPGGGAGGPACTPTVDGELVFALGQKGDLVCLETATGKERWRINFVTDYKGTRGGWDYCESPLVDGEKLVCTPGGKEHTILALNKKTGAMIPGWKGDLAGGSQAGYSSIVVSEAAGKRQYVQLLNAGVVGVAADDGTVLWHYKKLGPNTANIPTPIVRGDYVFSSAGYGKGGALLKLVADSNGGATVEEIYFKKELTNKHGGVVLVGEYLFGDRDDSGNPYCAQYQTGKITDGWSKRAKHEGAGSAAVTFADGHLYIRYDNGWVSLVEANPEDYVETGAFKIPNSNHQSWAHPVVVGGRLYLREKDILWCYDLKQ